MRSTLWKIGAALVGGVVATALEGELLKRAAKLPASLRPPLPSRHPGVAVLERGERLIGRLRAPTKLAAAQGLHWAYGLAGPLALGIVSSAIRSKSLGKTVLAGAGVGALVWAAGYVGWLPALELVPPVHKVPIRQSAVGLINHVAYGALASLPLAIAARRVEA